MAAANHAHFIGIAGIAMSAVALLLREQGWSVSGSDEGFYPPASEILPAAGVTILTPHAAGNIPPETTLIVLGSLSTHTPANPEVAAAWALHREQGIALKPYAEVVRMIAEGRQRLVVCGSYGKSTTASLVAWALTHAGVDAGYMLGARAVDLPRNSHLGTAAPFVLEGDEYPSRNTDNKAKFLHYAPDTVVVTSAQHDHPNVFPTHGDYLKSFQELLAGMGTGTTCVMCADDEHVRGLVPYAAGRCVMYGLDAAFKPDYTAHDITYGMLTTFTLAKHGKALCRVTSTQLGEHNVQNMVGAAALLLENGLVSPEQFAAAMRDFHGIKRRMERLNPEGSIPVYEGFGSSADKARSAIAAMRLHFPHNRLVTIFEPHTLGWINRVNLPDYDTAFTGTDELFVYPPRAGGDVDRLSQSDIMERLVKSFQGNAYALTTDLAANMAAVTSHIQPDDVVLILTSAHLGGLIPPLTEFYSKA
ncbi:MAG: Mur ligase family protein [Alphaproteobacteria bacterium]